MVKYLTFTILLILLGGCSSTYTVSDKSKNLLPTLDYDSARNLLLAGLKKSEQGGGFCIGGLEMRSDYKNHESLDIDSEGNLKFFAIYKGKSSVKSFHFIKDSSESMLTKQGWEAGEFSLNLHEIKQIRVKDTSGSYMSTYCEGLIPGKLVMVNGGDGFGFFVNVTESNIDNVIAGLLYFAKDPALKQGLGF